MLRNFFRRAKQIFGSSEAEAETTVPADVAPPPAEPSAAAAEEVVK